MTIQSAKHVNVEVFNQKAFSALVKIYTKLHKYATQHIQYIDTLTPEASFVRIILII